MADDDLKVLRDTYEHDRDAWAEAREARAKDIRALNGDPWDPKDREIREAAGRPCESFDELTQHVNTLVNEFRANPLSVEFSPGPAITAGTDVITATDEAADLYADAMREMEYRCSAAEVYTTAAENAVQGGYGFVRLVSEYVPGSFQQRLAIKSVPDPNTVIPNWDWLKPDLSDMRRCFVLEERPIADFRREFPGAAIKDFGDYLKDNAYRNWVKPTTILLGEYWCVEQQPVTWLLIQPAAPPAASSMLGLQAAPAPDPVTIRETDWPLWRQRGATVIKERKDTEPVVYQQLVNGVEVLEDKSVWPGPYIPIAGCMGRILYLDEGGTAKRTLLSSIRLALGPQRAYNFYRTSEIETVGMITKNPYWAYVNQVTPEQQNEIAKSMHEPVAVLFAQARTPDTGQDILPLPARNPQSADLSAFSLGAEEARRGVLSALGQSALPTTAQRQNEKSGIALQQIEQSRSKGTFHFFDHYKGMVEHVGRLFEAAFDTFHDTSRQIPVRRQNGTVEQQWINHPGQQGSIDVRGSYAVTVSAAPMSVDNTRQAASEFADNLLASKDLMLLLGPQKSQKIAALAVKLKVSETGIGAIGKEIVEIIDPPTDGQPDPQALLQHVQQADQLMQQMTGRIKELEDDQAGKMALEQQKGQTALEKARMDNEVKLAVAELGAKVDRLALFYEERARLGTQQHDTALAAADAGHDEHMANQAALVQMAQPPAEPGAGAGA